MTANKQNYYAIFGPGEIVGGFLQSQTSPDFATSVKPADLAAFDKKIDDGNGSTGNIVSGTLKYSCDTNTTGIIAESAPGCSDPGGVYNLGSSNNVCIPLIRIGGIAGDPQ